MWPIEHNMMARTGDVKMRHIRAQTAHVSDYIGAGDRVEIMAIGAKHGGQRNINRAVNFRQICANDKARVNCWIKFPCPTRLIGMTTPPIFANLNLANRIGADIFDNKMVLARLFRGQTETGFGFVAAGILAGRAGLFNIGIPFVMGFGGFDVKITYHQSGQLIAIMMGR